MKMTGFQKVITALPIHHKTKQMITGSDNKDLEQYPEELEVLLMCHLKVLNGEFSQKTLELLIREKMDPEKPARKGGSFQTAGPTTMLLMR